MQFTSACVSDLEKLTTGSVSNLKQASSPIIKNEPLPAIIRDPEEEAKKRLDELMSKVDPHNILILGGASQFASHVAVRLLFYKNNKITLADSKDSNVAFLNPDMQQYEGSERIQIIQPSLWDWGWLRETLKNNPIEYDSIVNCSFVSDAVYAANNPIETQIRNGVFGVALMDVLRQCDYQGKIIQISSDKVYGKYPPAELPLKENFVLKPSGVRAVTRAAQEMAMTGMSDAYGLSYMVFRMGTIYGNYTPREKAIYQWIRNLILGEPVVLNGNFGRDNSPSRDWVHVYDASMAVNIAVMTDWSLEMRNQIYNIGGCEKRERYLQNVSESLKPTIRSKSPTIRGPWRNREEDKDLHIWLDCTKAKEKLGYDPVKEFAYGMTRDMALWIAQYDLQLPQVHIMELERQLGIIDKYRESQALAEVNSDRMARNLPPITSQVLVEQHSVLGKVPYLSRQSG